MCDFIESLVLNTYDEYGEIYLSSEMFDFNNWKDIHEYEKVVPEVTSLQGLALAVLGFVVIFLMIYSCYLYSKLRQRAWNPRDSAYGPAAEAGKMSRMNSGIMMGRSSSGSAARGAYA